MTVTTAAPAADNPHLPFLVLGDYHLSAKKARIVVMELMARMKQPCPDGGWERALVTSQKGDKVFYQATFPEMVEEARRTGIVPYFQRLFDKEDSAFGGTHAGDFGTANYMQKIGTTYRHEYNRNRLVGEVPKGVKPLAASAALATA